MAQSGAKRTRRRVLSWALWLCLSLACALALGQVLLGIDSTAGAAKPGAVLGFAAREFFLPGKTTQGHYQIELSCESCHTAAFSDTEDFQKACVGCHEADLAEGQDSHPQSKFTDPRNAQRVEQLDARYCVTCHSEHQPERTHAMGLSLPEDYCYRCHQDIAEERESHKDLAFSSCASAGCHNFHDNRALYEDYLVRHGGESALLATPFRVMKKSAGTCPSPARAEPQADVAACAECHEPESTSYQEGLHGMRLAAGLAAMEPGWARRPMKEAAHAQALSCQSCHLSRPQSQSDAALAPQVDTATTTGSHDMLQVAACLGCHNDKHSLGYRDSKHYQLWQMETRGRVAVGSGVTCASCHMPWARNDDGELWVNHNQNHNLRPNEKMIRDVCSSCHGLAFSIDALADRAVIDSGFSQAPTSHVTSVDWALARD